MFHTELPRHLEIDTDYYNQQAITFPAQVTDDLAQQLGKDARHLATVSDASYRDIATETVSQYPIYGYAKQVIIDEVIEHLCAVGS